MSPESRKEEKLNGKPERKDLSLRRETVRKPWCHSLPAGVSLLQREVPEPEYSKRKKGVGVSEHGISPLLSLSLSLSLSFHLQYRYSITFSLSYTSVHASPLCHFVSVNTEQEAGIILLTPDLSNFPI